MSTSGTDNFALPTQLFQIRLPESPEIKRYVRERRARGARPALLPRGNLNLVAVNVILSNKKLYFFVAGLWADPVCL